MGRVNFANICYAKVAVQTVRPISSCSDEVNLAESNCCGQYEIQYNSLLRRNGVWRVILIVENRTCPAFAWMLLSLFQRRLFHLQVTIMG